MNDPVFSEYARYYDLLYKDKDYAAEAEYIASLIRRFRPEAGTILELGSGTGKHALLLAQKGYEVLGVERSEEMLECARALAKSYETNRGSEERTAPEFVQGDIRTVHLNRQFDVVLSLFHVMSYQATNEDLLAAFGTAGAHLAKDGLFVFDVWYGPAVLTDKPAVRIKRVADEQIEATRLAEPVLQPERNLVDVNYHVFIRNRRSATVSEVKERHRMRYFFTPELELMLGTSDLRLVHGEEWMTGRPPGTDTWGVCFVSQRALPVTGCIEEEIGAPPNGSEESQP